MLLKIAKESKCREAWLLAAVRDISDDISIGIIHGKALRTHSSYASVALPINDEKQELGIVNGIGQKGDGRVQKERGRKMKAK